MDTIEDIAKKITPAVRKFSRNYHRTRGTRGCRREIQVLKNKFVDLTQFEHDPLQRKLLWQADIERAADSTVKEECPNWKTEKQHLIVYKSIQETKKKALNKNPRREWLFQIARAWLQSLEGEVEKSKIDPNYQIHVAGEQFHPKKTIAIAYHIFLRGTGEIASFVRYLEKTSNKHIKKIIEAYKGHLQVKYKRYCLAVFQI